MQVFETATTWTQWWHDTVDYPMQAHHAGPAMQTTEPKQFGFGLEAGTSSCKLRSVF